MKRLIFIVLMMVCSVSWARLEKAGSTDDFDWYYDRSTIRKNGKIVKMWTIRDYFEEQDYGDGKKYKSSKSRYVYNCMDDTNAIIALYHYSGSMGNGEIIFSGDRKENEWDWSSVVPGSSGEIMFKIACGKR